MLIYGIGIFIIGFIMRLLAQKKLKSAETEEDTELKEALISSATKSLKWGKVNMIIGVVLTAIGIGFLTLL